MRNRELISARRALLDETFRSAWWRFVRLWRPMAWWTLLVWALIGVMLGPLSSAVLGHAVFRGDRLVVGNEDLLSWVLTTEGLVYVVVTGSLLIIGAVVRYAGLFRILTDDMSGQPVSVRQTLFELLPDVPALFRLCMSAVAAAVLLLIPLVAGLGVVYLFALADHDINYYLAVRPPEWYGALVAAALWSVAWVVGASYVLLRSLPALPAFLDGHRPIGVALREGWARSRGDAARGLWLVFLCLGTWLLVRTLAHAAYFFLAATATESLAGTGASLLPTILATSAWTAGAVAMDAVLSFFGFSLAATVFTKFYYEDTDLHAAAPPVALGLGALPGRVAGLLQRWLHPKRALPALAALLLVSAGLSVWLLRGVPEEPDFVITAHRAGAHLATENTLAALERSIEAGADFAEIDVQRTRDGVAVVSHDADLMRLAGDPRRIARTEYDDLADIVLGSDGEVPPEERRLATLDEFLKRAQGRIGLNIELKYYGSDPQLARQVVEAVRAREMEEEVVIMSLNLSAVRRVQQLAPEIKVGYVTSVSVGELIRLPVQFLAVSRPMATDRLLRAAQRRDIDVHVWTLNRTPAMLDVVERGAAGVFTDDPRLAFRLREELADLSAPERLLLSFRRVLLGEGE